MKCYAETATEWNDAIPIGTDVIVLLDGSQKATVTKTKSEAWDNIRGGASVLLDGISGGYALTHVYAIEEQSA
ncbi:MAG: hypothetical protein JKY93_00955 [Gammaproteobacteria bacterium]|nr:hypothetical protein [Gammaproteobacteria bacterium]